MSIKDEIKSLIQTLQDQLKNFEDVPDERLEAFLTLCVDQKDNYSDERIQTRELQIALLCLEADVRNKDCIGHCGEAMEYDWQNDEWVSYHEGEDDDEEEIDE